MNKRKWLLTAVLMATLILSMAACGGEEATQAPAPTAAVQQATDTPLPPTDTPIPPTDTPIPPTDTPIPEPTEAAAPAEGLDVGSLAQLSDLTSYRSRMFISIEGTDAGEEVSASMDMLIEFTAEPPAQHLTMSMQGMEADEGTEGFENIEMYIVEGTMYIRMGEEWMSAPAEGDPLSGLDMFSSEEILEDTCGWTKQGDTEVNGVEVHHWRIDQEALEECLTAEQLADMGDVDEITGDLYVAIDGNYLVKMEITLAGRNMQSVMGETEDGLDEGRIQITMELLDVNEPFTIELPEEAMSSSGLPEDIPLPDDAEEVSSMMGFVSFVSASKPAELSEFYRTEMPNNGWTEVSAEEMGTMMLLEFSKDGRSASFMISEDSDTGKSSVLVTVAEE